MNVCDEEELKHVIRRYFWNSSLRDNREGCLSIFHWLYCVANVIHKWKVLRVFVPFLIMFVIIRLLCLMVYKVKSFFIVYISFAFLWTICSPKIECIQIIICQENFVTCSMLRELFKSSECSMQVNDIYQHAWSSGNISLHEYLK